MYILYQEIQLSKAKNMTL